MKIVVRIAASAAALLLLSAASSAGAGARQDGKVLMSSNPDLAQAENEWGFSDAITVGDTLYLSGVVAGLRPGETDLRVGYARAFARIDAILKAAGSSWDDVVDITTFHTDVKAQMPAIVEVKNRFVKAPFPAWTAIQVVRLIPDNGVTEIKVVAKLSKPRP